MMASVGTSIGRVAGAVGTPDGMDVVHRQVHANHKTQEEDVISGWLVAEAGYNSASQSALFKATVAGKWGMLNPDTGSRRTRQGTSDNTVLLPLPRPKSTLFLFIWSA